MTIHFGDSTSIESGSGLGGIQRIYQHSTTGGTAVTSFSVDGYFDDSKYKHYQAVISDMYIASEGTQHTSPSMRFNVGGSAVTSQNYAWAFNESYGSGIHNRGSGTGSYETSISQMQGTWNVAGTTRELQNFNIFFYNPTTTGLGAKYVNWTSAWHQYTNSSGTKYMGANVAMGVLVTNSALTGFTIYNPNGFNFTYKISLYGFKI